LGYLGILKNLFSARRIAAFHAFILSDVEVSDVEGWLSMMAAMACPLAQFVRDPSHKAHDG
jgi:hypothetical protein